MTIVSSDSRSAADRPSDTPPPAIPSPLVSVDPATGVENGAVTSATPDRVDAAVRAARAAFPAWRRTSPGARAAALRAAAAELRADADRVADLHMRDTGRLLAD